MTREIRFRAWDEQNKVIHNDVEFIRSGVEGNDWIIFKSDKQKLEDKKVLDNPYFAQQIKLMQFTGLLDKNGKEIYEGDCVYVEPVRDGGGEFYIVSWASNGRWYLQNKEANKDSGDLVVQKLEIIGNIYENPELLSNPQ